MYDLRQQVQRCIITLHQRCCLLRRIIQTVLAEAKCSEPACLRRTLTCACARMSLYNSRLHADRRLQHGHMHGAGACESQHRDLPTLPKSRQQPDECIVYANEELSRFTATRASEISSKWRFGSNADRSTDQRCLPDWNVSDFQGCCSRCVRICPEKKKFGPPNGERHRVSPSCVVREKDDYEDDLYPSTSLYGS